jgi:hypothetical protein
MIKLAGDTVELTDILAIKTKYLNVLQETVDRLIKSQYNKSFINPKR